MRVIIDSPFRGRQEYLHYARICLLDSIKRGEYPFASHLLYTQVLNEEDERELGIKTGLEWGKVAEKTVVYCDYGISEGMTFGIQSAKENNRPVEYRRLFN